MLCRVWAEGTFISLLSWVKTSYVTFHALIIRHDTLIGRELDCVSRSISQRGEWMIEFLKRFTYNNTFFDYLMHIDSLQNILNFHQDFFKYSEVKHCDRLVKKMKFDIQIKLLNLKKIYTSYNLYNFCWYSLNLETRWFLS